MADVVVIKMIHNTLIKHTDEAGQNYLESVINDYY